MNHDEFVAGIAASMGGTTPKEMEEERAEALKQAEENQQKNDDEMFIINIPMITGRVYKVDSRQVNWDEMGKPESQANLEQNEGIIRGMVHHLITADFSDPKTDQMIADFDESVMNLFKNFGIEDPGYEYLKKQCMVKPYILLLGKCFDALTLINVMAHNTAMHGLASHFFGMADEFKKIADLNDITDMDNSAGGLITEDRKTFEEVDDHDVSGLVTED